jgi:DNA-binding response OmpR family regulator
MRLLLVEDNKQLGALASQALKSAGFAVDFVRHREEAEAVIAEISYDLVIFDLGLPDCDCPSLIPAAKRHLPAASILVVTAKDMAASTIEALNAGADGCLTKPIVMDVLVAHVRALLRRQGGEQSAVLVEQNVELDPGQYRLRVAGRDVPVSRRELAALELLMRRSRRLISRSEFEESLYGFGEEVSSKAIEVLIHRLRKKLKDAGADIEVDNLRGLGYMLSGRQM